MEKKGRIIASFRFMTKSPSTSDEYGIKMVELLSFNHILVKDIKNVIISSVVPDIMHTLTNSIIKLHRLYANDSQHRN